MVPRAGGAGFMAPQQGKSFRFWPLTGLKSVARTIHRTRQR